MKKKLLILLNFLCYKCLPLEWFLKLKYYYVFKRRLDLDHPERFSEKIFCLKQIYEKEQRDVIRRCYDKVKVRSYVAESVGEERSRQLLNELYGVYEKPEDIDFEALPQSFVLKVTQSSGYNIICPNKEKLDRAKTIKQLRKWQRASRSACGKSEEGYAFDGNPVICCEKYLSFDDGTIPPDIRVYCFHGTPKLFVCDFGTTNSDGSHGHNIVRNVYDENWNLLDVDLGRPHDPETTMAKPSNLGEIVDISKSLSKDFYFVRVDLYNLHNKVIFGELTWIPMGGMCVVSPDSFDLEMGSWLRIPDWRATVKGVPCHDRFPSSI